MRKSRRPHQQQSRFGQFLRRYSFEIVWLIVAAFGIFLLLERMNIRVTLMRWIQTGIAGFLRSAGRVDEALLALVTRTSLSDAIGLVLIAGVLASILLRVRWRLLRTPALAVIKCPRCGGVIHRVHRRLGDRLVSWFVPVRRYRCANKECRWCGLRIPAGKDRDEAATAVVES